MRDSKQKTENAWLKRLTRFFRRDKTGKPKQKIEITSEIRKQRAVAIFAGTGVFMLFILVIFAFAYRGRVISSLFIFDTRFLVGVMTLASFISAWLARRGKTTTGAIVILSALYTVILLSAFANQGAGIVSAAFAIIITLAITSTVMPVEAAKRVNVIPLVVSIIPILLDLFQPFPRVPDPDPSSTVVVTVIMLIVFSFLVVRQFNTYNLRTKLLIAFAAVTLVPLISSAVYNNKGLSDVLYQNIQATQGQFANQTASRMDDFIENQLTSIQIQSKNPPFIQYLSLNSTERTNSPEEINAQNALAALASQNTKFINDYVLVDNTGIVVLDTAGKRGGDNGTMQFFKQVAAKNQPLVSGPFVDQQNGKANLYFSAPVKNQTGALLGTLAVEYNANVVESIVESLIPSGDSNSIFFRVVDKNTFIRIANTNNPELLYKSFKDFTPVEVTALQKQGLLLPQNALAPESETLTGLEKLDQSPFFTTTIDKTLLTKNLNSGAQLKNVPWLALVTQSEEVVLTPLREQTRTTTLIFIFLLMLVTLAAFGLSQLLASPILSLGSTAQKIAAGDLSLQSDIESNDEIGVLAGAFNAMTRQLRSSIDSLDQRSKALATSSEVSRRISTILDQKQLVVEVVKQVQSAFNYYHAHIYLTDESTGDLMMAGGTGEAGQAMLARGHKIAKGKGLVGRAAESNSTVLVSDVSQDSQWLPNPLLPETKSEIAVPISIGDKVLGVLDVQHNVAGALKQEDADVLQSIANQVAFAVRNARSYSEVQAQADRETLIGSIGQKIQGTISVESALQVAIREIGRALNGAKTQVVLNENSTSGNAPESKTL